jgi:hypothetical protein
MTIPRRRRQRDQTALPAASRLWSRRVSYNESSYEQTRIIRDAVEMVVRLTSHGEGRRDEIAKIVLSIADHENYEASALANLAIAAMADASRKSA